MSFLTLFPSLQRSHVNASLAPSVLPDSLPSGPLERQIAGLQKHIRFCREQPLLAYNKYLVCSMERVVELGVWHEERLAEYITDKEEYLAELQGV